MVIALYTVGGQYMSYENLENWLSILHQRGIECYVNSEFVDSFNISHTIKTYKDVSDLPQEVEMAISYGGDGTFLQCINRFVTSNIPILGVNSGRLGFLAAAKPENINSLVDDIANRNYTIETRSMLYCKELDAVSLNELTIQKQGLNMIDIEFEIDGEQVAEFMADGVIVATPTGSTAYSLSVGGAILSPHCNCFIMNPIAPHNLNLRPLIIGANSIITVRVDGRNNDIIATMDNREYPIKNSTQLTITKSHKKAKLVKLEGITFYGTLREKMMWSKVGRYSKT